MQNSLQGWQHFSPATVADATPGLSLARDLGNRFGVKIPALDHWIDNMTACPWPATTPVERKRRDEPAWTLVQGILAPLQFLVLLVSVTLVARYLVTGQGYEAATLSILLKTGILYTIMVTGAIWEKKVFGQYLFAPAFYWEDMVSMLVIALHTGYVVALIYDWGSPENRMILALAGYASYVVNAAQFLLKLRAARLDADRSKRSA
jgi:3-vinyl bacteriochlorophyllide hydratase